MDRKCPKSEHRAAGKLLGDRVQESIVREGAAMQAANPVRKTIYHLVKQLGVKLDVVFLWDDKPKAAYRGKTAHMRYVP